MLKRDDAAPLARAAGAASGTARPVHVVAGYKSGGRDHVVLVRRDTVGRWQVLDRAGARTRLVETLHGHDDRLAQAVALARDYARQQQAFHDGDRLESPLPERSASASAGSGSGAAGVAASDR